MLKRITALTAVAGILSIPVTALAETEGPTVYGRISFGIKSVSGETDADDKQELSRTGGAPNHLGIRGSSDIGNGLTASYNLEYQTSADGKDNPSGLSLRNAFITVDGGFGQFRLGKQVGVTYRYIGANADQSWFVGGKEYYAIAGSMNSDHSLRMKNIAAYRFGAGPGGNDPFTFDIQIQSKDLSKGKEDAKAMTYLGKDMYLNSLLVSKRDAVTGVDAEDPSSTYSATDGEATTYHVPGKAAVSAEPAITEEGAAKMNAATIRDNTNTQVRMVGAMDAMDDDETIDSVTLAAATALGPVKLQVAYVDENGGDGASPNLLSLGLRVPLGSAELRGHVTSVDPDKDGYDDHTAWGLLVMNSFGGGYSGMIGVGNYRDGNAGMKGTDLMKGGRYVQFRGQEDKDKWYRTADLNGGDANEAYNLVAEETREAAPTNATDGAHVVAEENRDYKAKTKGTHKNAGDLNSVYASLTKSFGGGLSAIAEYRTVSTTVTGDDYMDDDDSTENTFILALSQSF